MIKNIKNNIKSFVCGVVLTAIVTTSISVFAVNTIQKAYYNQLKLVVNGKTIKSNIVTVVDKGQSVGKNYVLVKDIAGAFGCTEKTANNIITVAKKVATSSPSSVSVYTPKIDKIDTKNLPDPNLIPTNVKLADVEKNPKVNDSILQNKYDILYSMKYKNNIYVRFVSLWMNMNSKGYNLDVKTINNVKYLQVYTNYKNVKKIVRQQALQLDDLVYIEDERLPSIAEDYGYLYINTNIMKNEIDNIVK